MAIFEFLDHYLLDGSPERAEVVTRLLTDRPGGTAAQPFYDGMRLLGARTPELSLVALRLVLAGKKADDESVIRLRDIVERARRGDAEARAAYRAEIPAEAP
jgi:hypothetical protein